MKIKNNYTSHLGFGSARILPGETIDANQLPKGYNENHPLIKFYIKQGWLEVVAGKIKTAEVSAKPVSTNIKIDTNTEKVADDGTGGSPSNEIDDDSRAEMNGDDASDDGASDSDGNQSKPLSRMNKAELQTLATELGLEFSSDDSNSALIEKIKAARKVEE